MYTEYGQIIFHYANGETEAFSVYPLSFDGEEPVPQINLEECLQQLQEKKWLILQLADDTICINTDQVLRVEIRPVVTSLPAERVLGAAERITALSRGR
ncbi:MAG: hypothetical protein AAGF24_12590 [Cyanobacteria bacterium P01_H01_bin.121]